MKEVYRARTTLEKKKKIDSAGALPDKVKVPQFNGDIIHYPDWWEEFKEVVHENEKVSKFYKLSYLKSSMKGSAAHVLSGISLKPENYEKALELVKMRFGRKRVITRHLVRSLAKMEPAASGDPKAFRDLADKLSARFTTLKTQVTDVDQLIIPLMEDKLPQEIRQLWERKLGEMVDDDAFADEKMFFDFVRKEASAQTASSEHNPTKDPPKKSDKKVNKVDNKKSDNSMKFSAAALPASVSSKKKANATTTEESECGVCGKKNHGLEKCEEFLALSTDDRREVIEDHHRCRVCLKSWKTHKNRRYCSTPCKNDGCDKRHHKLLCDVAPIEGTPEVVTSCTTRSIVGHVSTNTDVLLPMAVAKLRNGNRTQVGRIGFDTFSHSSFITKESAEKLKLKISKPILMTIRGFGGKPTTKTLSNTEFDIVSLDGARKRIRAIVADGPICDTLSSVEFSPKRYGYLKDVELADELPRGAVELEVLIGADYYGAFVHGMKSAPKSDLPFVLTTMFGNVLAGPYPTSKKSTKSQCMLTMTGRVGTVEIPEEISTEKVQKTIENFWKIEAIGIIDKDEVFTRDEQRAVEIFEKTTTFKNGRYEVELPFRDDAPLIANNYVNAKKQLESTERRLMKNEESKQQYEKAIDEYVDLGFAKELSMKEAQEVRWSKNAYYVPHHAVVRESSVSTKIRIVSNASSPDRNGISLNDTLLPGPPLQPDIGQVLIRFRSHKYVFSGDLQKMFLQTSIAEKHWKYQLYLWRACDPSIEPKIFAMTRIMFGVSSSPFLAGMTVRTHAKQPEMINRYPKAVENVKDDLYVDDCFGGANNEEDVIDLQQQNVKFFEAGGWKLTKFASNSATVMKTIKEEDRLPGIMLDFDEDDNDYGRATTLGLRWNTCEDTFMINLSEKLSRKIEVVTKREILAKSHAVYDVFGFVSAYTVRAKIIVQELWKQKVKWDQPLQGALVDEFREWEKELPLLPTINIPRWIRVENKSRIQIQGFCDASERAYGSIVYLHVTDEDGNVSITFLIAKTRVAPLKPISLARLELLAIHCLAKLVKYVLDAVRFSVEAIHLWSDSMIALSWVRKPSSTWKTFVRNRVQEIHDIVSPNVFRHCPTEDNPADDLTRSLSLSKIKTKTSYWQGPNWLKRDSKYWPAEPKKNEKIVGEECDKEKAKETISLTITEPEPYPAVVERNEKFPKIVRVVAYMLRWKRKIQAPEPNNARELDTNALKPKEVDAAEDALWRLVQRRHFPLDHSALTEGKPIEKRSRILEFDPKFDKNRGLIIGGDRLQFSNLQTETKNPILLPANDVIVRKMILHVHTAHAHAPQDTTLALVRQRYLVIHGRQEIRKALRECLVCRHAATKSLEQKMGSLPEERVTPGPAWTTVGIDFTGAIYVKGDDGKSRKVYIAVFTCATSRMIHFELVNDMTTEEFLLAFRRMLNRRGMCRTIISDNARYFIKADKILQLSFEDRRLRDINAGQLQDFLTERKIEWKFICPRAPERGAFWERLNRSLKEPLRKILGKALLSFTEMSTVLTDIECTLNQRPLTYQGSDPKNPMPITPAHLALGRALEALPPHRDDPTISTTKRYRHIQSVLNHFWKRWSREYVPNLMTRKKWRQEMKVPSAGDVVMITEENTSRPKWQIARVIEGIKGKDGLVRTFRLKTAKGIILRPVQRLHLLEPDETDVEIQETENEGEEKNEEKQTTPNPITIANEKSNEEVLVDGLVDQGGVDIRTPIELRQPTTTTRSGRKSYKPIRY